jgi:hypothetical protein
MSKLGERFCLTSLLVSGKIYQKLSREGFIMVENKGAEKVCSLYVNNMHLIVMLIPYIEKELERGRKIVTILEDDLKEEVETLINKVNLTEEKKNGLKSINWNKNGLLFGEISKIEDDVILVNGSYDFIKNVNSCINDNAKKVINCFELNTFEDNSREILENHNKILNTLGEKKISEMFRTKVSPNIILTK